MTPVLCLDFGSAFTKVGFRSDPDGPSRILTDETLRLDVNHFCIPSVVVADRRGKTPVWTFGEEGLDVQEQPGVKVFRNWKPLLFAPNPVTPEAAPTSVPDAVDKVSRFLAALGAISESRQREKCYAELAASFDIQLPQVRAAADEYGVSLDELREGVRRTQLVAVTTGPLGAEQLPTPDPVSPPKSRDEARPPGPPIDLEIREVALRFFTWLRGFVAQTCRKKYGIEDLQGIPTRVCVPAFATEGGASGAVVREYLLEMLDEAGWNTMHARHPVLSEPLANAVGVLTGGRNCTWVPKGQDRPCIHIAKMFGDGVVREALSGQRPQGVIVVVDVGAYTTDFARVEFLAPSGPSSHRITTHSEPLGVAELDRRVFESLPDTQRQIVTSISSRQQETFRENVYVKNIGVRLRKGEEVAGQRLEQVQEVIEQFASELCDRLDEFLGLVSVVDGLVLTGGGIIIPRIRQTILARLQPRKIRRIHRSADSKKEAATHVDKFGVPAGNVIPLTAEFLRGGSALGGTSIYFDEEDLC